MKRSRILSVILTLVMILTMTLSGVTAVTAQTADNLVVTLGANLSAEQKASILQFFGVSEDEVTILVITNDDEREKLGDLIPLEQIGNQTYSCAMVCPTDANGIQVKTANMNYVTGNMIAATLSTSGVVNCDVLAAAPFEVSGTGALTGVIMAYEQAIGHELDEDKKELANEELVATNEIGEEVGQDEAILIINDIKIRIIRDEVPAEEVEGVVDEVLNTINSAAAASGKAMAELSQDNYNTLYELGKKIADMGYDYEEMKNSLQRVAQNITEETGIDDPIMDSFEDKISNKIDEDSILNHTDDSALGLSTEDTSTTFEDPSLSETVTFDGNYEADNVTLIPYSTPASSDWVDETSFLEIQGNDGYGFMTVDGKTLADTVYRSLMGEYNYIEGILPNGTLNYRGALNQAGEVVIPFEYGYLRFYNASWAVALVLTDSDEADYDVHVYGADNEYQKIETADIYYLENDQAKKLASLTRDEYADSYAYGKVINIENRTTGEVTAYNTDFEVIESGISSVAHAPDDEYTGLLHTYRYNGQYGLMDAEGNIIMEAAYKSIYVAEGQTQFSVSTGSAEGVIDSEGNELIPAEFDEVLRTSYLPKNEQSNSNSGYVAAGYAAAIKDGKIVFCDYNGNISYETGLTEDDMGGAYEYTNCGASILYQDAEGSYHILAADGVETVLDSYARVTALYYASGMLYRVQDDNYSVGLIDWHGNVLFDTKFDKIALSADGNYLLAYEYTAGSSVFEINIDAPEYIAREKTEKTETETTPHEELSVGGSVSIQEYASYEDNSMTWIYNGNLIAKSWANSKLYNIDDQEVSDTEHYSYNVKYLDYILTEDSADDLNKEGILNLQGEEIVSIQYDNVEFANEHWAIGMFFAEGSEDDYDYQNWSDDSYYVIDTADIYYLEAGTAKLVTTLTRDQIGSYNAFGEYLNVQDRSENTNCYDKDWNVAESGLHSAYSTPDVYVPDYQTYRENGQSGIMDKNGNIVMKAGYQSITIQDNYAVLSDGEKYGLADLTGNVLVPVAYDRIKINYQNAVTKDSLGGSSYVTINGYVAVELDDKVGFCDVNGNETVTPAMTDDEIDVYGATIRYQDADGITHLLAADNVDTALSADYEYVYSMDYSSGMLYKVRNADYNYGLIDWHGDVILPLEYSSLELSADGKYLIAVNDNGTTIYQVFYSEEDANGGATEAVKEETAEETKTEEQTEETPETEPQTNIEEETESTTEAAEETAASGDEDDTISRIVTILEGAKALAEADYAGNKENVKTLVSQVAVLLESVNADAASLLDSAVQLIDSGITDGSSISLLLESAMELLK